MPPVSFQAPTDLVLTLPDPDLYPPVQGVSLLSISASRFRTEESPSPWRNLSILRPTATRDASCPCHPEKRRLT